MRGGWFIAHRSASNSPRRLRRWHDAGGARHRSRPLTGRIADRWHEHDAANNLQRCTRVSVVSELFISSGFATNPVATGILGGLRQKDPRTIDEERPEVRHQNLPTSHPTIPVLLDPEQVKLPGE